MSQAVWLLTLALAAPPARVAESGDEQALRAAGIRTDAASLLDFFRKHTLGAEDVRKIEALIRALGSRSFAVRERASAGLVKWGRAALPLLRAALSSRDIEVARRAARCLEELDRGPGPGLAASAARVLARRAPKEAVAILLAYAPHADDDNVAEAVREALLVLSPPDKAPEPALSAALRDPSPARRGAAAHVLGRKKDAESRAAVRALLKDRDPGVRFLAVRALLFGGDREAVPALIALLSDAPLGQSWQLEELLFRLAGEQAPAVSLGDASPAARRKARAAWEGWWAKHGARVDLARLGNGKGLAGLTLGIEYSTNRVWECGPDGHIRWEITANNGPMEAWVLPGNRVLIADNTGVCERDFKGSVLWRLGGVGGASGCQRLPNGNTFVSTYNSVMEFGRDGRRLYHHNIPGSNAIRKHRNGHIIYTTNQEIVEIDTAGKTVRKVPLPPHSMWVGIEDVPGDHFMVANSSTGRVLEVDAAGKVVWEGNVRGACGVSKLPNGRVLVAGPQRVVELDRGGKVVWEKKVPGYARRVHRR